MIIQISENEYYSVKFTMYSGDNSWYIFRMNIYYGLINYILYDIEEKNATTFEMLFYGKKSLPLNITYKNYKLL